VYVRYYFWFVCTRHDPSWRPEPSPPIDYCYVRPHHIPAVNALCREYFWPGIDSQYMQLPSCSAHSYGASLLADRAWPITDTDSVLLCSLEGHAVLQSLWNTTIAPAWQFAAHSAPLCFLSDNQLPVHCNISPSIPCAFNFIINLLCGTLSNAFWKSKYMTSTR